MQNSKTITQIPIYSEVLSTGWNNNTILALKITKEINEHNDTNIIIKIQYYSNHNPDSCVNIELNDLDSDELSLISRMFQSGSIHLSAFKKENNDTNNRNDKR